jgi:16S rRNA (cytosine1402-N4)-methyltransferase
MNFEHFSVLLKETVDGLDIKPNGIYVDGTLGGGGHSEEILKRLDTGKLIGIDQDENALKAASERLKEYGDKFIPVRSNFSDILDVLNSLNIKRIDGMMMDLGVSSHQLDEADRGFSYRFDAPLDMRMDQRQALDAYKVVNTYSEDELNQVIRDFGEENWARRIAKFICEDRENKPIETTGELVDLIYRAIPAGARREGGHPAKRTFQAIRIEVNRELEILTQTIEDITSVLNKKGRIAIITFHSLEDRLVKHAFKALAQGCICPPELPLCVCNNKPKLKIITRKPILPSETELEHNSRSKSAKLRVARKI